MNKKLLVGLATGLFLVGIAGVASATLLFEDDFESGLTNWNETHGQIVTESNGNKALSFSSTYSAGDAFTMSSFIDVVVPGTFTLEFDYFSPVGSSTNGGGFVGIDPDGIRNNGTHTWLLGTNNYPGVTNLPISNGNWVAVSHTFSTNYSQIHLMIEDFRAPAGDALFDNLGRGAMLQGCCN
nr:hypothetical protein [Desulfobulbaceae bacterium]